jgi:hypothetical protein
LVLHIVLLSPREDISDPPWRIVERGSLIGICGAPLVTIGLPSEEALLLSVSRSRKNLSASIGVTSLVNVSIGSSTPAH